MHRRQYYDMTVQFQSWQSFGNRAATQIGIYWQRNLVPVGRRNGPQNNVSRYTPRNLDFLVKRPATCLEEVVHPCDYASCSPQVSEAKVLRAGSSFGAPPKPSFVKGSFKVLYRVLRIWQQETTEKSAFQVRVYSGCSGCSVYVPDLLASTHGSFCC